MKGKRFFKFVALLVSLASIVSACGAPAATATQQVQIIENTVEVPVTTVVEQEVIVTATAGPSDDENPYRPTELLDAVQAMADQISREMSAEAIGLAADLGDEVAVDALVVGKE